MSEHIISNVWTGKPFAAEFSMFYRYLICLYSIIQYVNTFDGGENFLQQNGVRCSGGTGDRMTWRRESRVEQRPIWLREGRPGDVKARERGGQKRSILL